MRARYVGCAILAFCALQLVAAAGPFYLTGTIRDFLKTGNSDFARSETSADVGVTSFVRVNTDVLGKPLATGTTTSTVSNFNAWWADGDLSLVAPYTITLTETGSNTGYFRYDSPAGGFYPINGQLGGNEGDPNNRYFTYELHTMFRYVGDGSDQMVFSSAGDLFVYLNGRLCGTALTGIHPTASMTVNPASCAAAAGMVNSPAQNYKVDIFYAHRSSATTPSLSVQLPLPRACNANTTAIGDKTLFPYTAANTIVSGISAITTPTSFRLSAYDQLNFNGAVYNSVKKRITNGFVSTFKFQVTNPGTRVAEGFAFVLQSTSTSARGSGGSNLGYNFVGSIAVEFDMANSGTGDSNANHIELHIPTNPSQPNSPSAYNIASTPVLDMNTAPVINMKDGAVHAVRILYAPCSGTPTAPCVQPAGVLAVYVDDILKLRCLVDDGTFRSMQSAGQGLAYVGFTVGTSSFASNIDITEWRFFTTPVSALLSIPVETPGAVGSCTAGCQTSASNALQQNSPFYILAADACGTALTVGGDSAAVAWLDNAATGAAVIADSGNGQYAVQYSQQKSGNSRLAVVLNSQPIALSPLTISVAPSVVAAAQSSWPGSIPTLTAGTAVPLVVTARDQFGNAVTAPNAPLTVQMASGVELRTMDAPSVSGNAFTFSVLFTLAGSAQLYVRANNLELPGSPFAATVVADVASGGIMDTNGLDALTPAGAWSSLRMYPTDRFGNAVQTAAGQTIVFQTRLLTNPAITGTTTFAFVPAANGANAYWNLTKTATVSGNYQLIVTVNGVSASGLAAVQDRIVPATVAAATSKTSLVSGTIFYAGASNSPAWTIQAYDMYGNLRSEANPLGQTFTVTITPPAAIGAALSVDCTGIGNTATGRGLVVTCRNNAANAGQYDVSLQCQRASTAVYTVATRLNGVLIGEPQRNFVCQPGGPDASKTTVTWSPVGAAGTPAQFAVTVRDAYNNTRVAGQGFPDVGLMTYGVTTPDAKSVQNVVRLAAIGTTGQYLGVYDTEKAGLYSVAVLFDTGSVQIGTPAQPHSQLVLAGATLASATQLSGDGLLAGRPPGPASFHLVAYDAYGNPRLANTDTFRATLYPNSGGAPSTFDSVPTSGSPGEYDIGYTVPPYSALVTGFDLVVRLTTAGLPGVLVQNRTISISSGLEAFVVIHAADGTSFPNGLLTHQSNAGAISSFQVTRTDSARVPTPGVSTNYEMDLTARTGGLNGAGDAARCTRQPFQQLQPGRYLFYYSCQKAGDYYLTVKGGGENVNATLGSLTAPWRMSPFNMTVTPGTVPFDVAVTALPQYVTAGAPQLITIQLLDAYGNEIASNAGRTLRLDFFDAGDLPLGSTPIATTTDITCATPTPVAGTGRYTVSLTSRIGGGRTIRFFLNGVQLPGRFSDTGSQTPPQQAYTVRPAAPQPSRTVLNFGVTPAGIANVSTSFGIQLRDAFGNLITDPGIDFAVQLQDNPALQYSSGYMFQFYQIQLTPIFVAAMDRNNPFPTLVITTPTFANLELSRGVMQLSAAALDPTRSFVTGLPTAPLPPPIGAQGQAVAGNPLTFSLTVRDAFGNGLSNINPNLVFRCEVSASLVDPSVPFPPLQLPNPTSAPQATVTAATQGVFTFTFTPTRAGTYTFRFFAVPTVAGVVQPVVRIPISVPTVTVVAGRATGFTPPLFFENPIWPAGRPQRFRTQAIDQFGNRLTYGGSQVALNYVTSPVMCNAALDTDVSRQFLSRVATYDPALVDPNSGALTDAVVDTLDGWFNVTVLTSVSGNFVLNVTINARPYLPCAGAAGVDTIVSRFTFQVSPNAFDPATSRIVALTPSGRAGDVFRLRIAASDRYKNPILVNPASPQIRLAPYTGRCAALARHWLADSSPSPDTTVTNVTLTTVPRDGLASYLDLSFVPRVARTAMFLNVTFNGTQIGSLVAPDPLYLNAIDFTPPQVTPLLGGTCQSLEVTSADTAQITKDTEPAIVAAIPTSYVARGFDRFGNAVVRDDHVFHATFRSTNISYQFGVTSVPVAPGTAPEQTVAYTPVWAGRYEVEVVVQDPRSTSGVLLLYTATVAAATCGGQTRGVLPFRCPANGNCVTAYAAATCASLIAPQTPNTCPVGTVACPDGAYCAAALQYCPPRQLDNCPAGFTYRCANGDCRASAADCPSDYACPPGYSPCADGRQCWKTSKAAECALPAGATCAAQGNTTLYLCQDGDCVRSKEDCPTRKTCPAGHVICSDGACAPSLQQCYDQYLCYQPTPLRCPDGSCRADVRDCPKEVTCPVGWVACENGYCSPTAAQCQAQIRCTSEQTRCPDGSCRPNLMLCPTVQSCPAAPGSDVSLVRCHDGACVPSVFHCAAPVQCSGAHNFTCPDSSCVSDYRFCTTGIRCPPESPVLCPDRTCVSQVAQCMQSGYCAAVTSGAPYLCPDGRCVAAPVLCAASLACPSARPVRCGDGSCQAAADECPVGLAACPDLQPVRCPDGACAAASDQCSSMAQLSCPAQTFTGAPFQFVRCPSGHCAPNLGSCPTPLTCGPNLNRCRDGTCRSRCDTVQANTCPAGQVTCPVSVQGPSCADSLASCPTTITCPADRPVRCIDASCAVSFADCPVAASYSANKVACPGSTWAPTLATCGTLTTCPKSLPAKCWDESCRLLAADCPPRPKCPAATPFACSDGSCYATLSDCRSAVRCNPAVSQAFRGTVKCPYYDNNLGANSAGCVASAADCEKYNPLTVPYTKLQSGVDSGLGSTQYRCPNLAKRCRDGSCRVDSTQCKDKDCPPHLPVRCPDGMCARAVAECRNALNTCPFDTPAMCRDGSCAASASACAERERTLVPGVSVCGNASLVTCPDGSCRSTASSCPQMNGCSSNSEPCHDRNCVQRSVGSASSQCVAPFAASADLVNACPYNRPFQCPDGYCALSSSFCPIYPAADAMCSVTTHPVTGATIVKPFRCADGTCVFNLAQCAPLAPCADTSHRCPDGTCRTGRPGQSTVSDGTETCPPYRRTCPADRPFRCEESGLCAQSAVGCIADSQEFAALYAGSSGSPSLNATAALAAFTGCPRNRVRCPSGRCATDFLSCSFPTTRWEFQAANGCPARSAGAVSGKCFDGSCDGGCAVPNGCPAATPFLCPNGQCTATAGSCVLTATTCAAGSVRCPDGQCATTRRQCRSKRRCPGATPYRCASGECARFPAAVTEGRLTPDAQQCKATVVCELPAPFLCADGSCAVSAGACRPLMPCNVGQQNNAEFPNLCTNLRCGNAALNSTCTRYENTCPPGNPVLCADGACRRSVEECNSGSIAAATCPDAAAPVLCFDGFCRASMLACVEAQFYATANAGTFDDTAYVQNTTCREDGEVLCTHNGACLPGGSVCPPVPACPSHLPRRCSNGACINGTASDCPAVGECQAFPGAPAAGDAANTMVRCPDGTCNRRDLCPVYDGCPLSRPYYCAGLAIPCVADAGECFTSLAANNLKPQACDFHCMRDLHVRGPLAYPAPQEADLTITLAVDARHKSRSTLLVPAGAVHPNAGLIEVAPVPLHAFSGVYAFLDANRAPEFGTDRFTSFTALKSAPFTVKATGAAADDAWAPQYGTSLALTVTAWIDPLLYQVTTQQAAAAANAAAVEIPCAYQASYAVERTLFTTDAAGQPVAIPCTGVSDVGKDYVLLQMDTCDGTVTAGDVVSVAVLPPIEGSSTDVSDACVCVNLTQSTPPPAALAPGYDVSQTVCTLYHRVVDAVSSYVYVDPAQATTQCPPQTAVQATTPDPAIRKLLYTAKNVPQCQNTLTGDAARFIPANDICLARARKPPSAASADFAPFTASWDCLFGRDERLANPVWSTAATGLGATEYRGVIPASALAVNGEFAYAFVHSPLPPPPPAERSSESAWEAYGKIILIVVITVGVFTIIAAYVTWRLMRYRRKYKENQKKKVELTERRNNLEEFSGGLGIADDEIDMVANPLVIELQNLEQQIKKVNDEMGVQEQRDAQTIARLEEDRKKLYAEIDRVKQAMTKAEAETEAAAKITAARETAAANARATALASANMSLAASASPLAAGGEGGAVDGGEVDNFASPVPGHERNASQVPVDAGSGTTATTTAKGTTRLDFGQAKIRRPRDISNG